MQPMLRILSLRRQSGRGAFHVGQSHTVRNGELHGSDDAGMSSEKIRGKRIRRKSKVSWGRLIRPGLVGPKPRPKGVGEGQSVKYSDTTYFAFEFFGGRRRLGPARGWMCASKPVVPPLLQWRDERWGSQSYGCDEGAQAMLPRKSRKTSGVGNRTVNRHR